MAVVDASGDFIDFEIGTRIGVRAEKYFFPNATGAELRAMHGYRFPSLSWLLYS